MIHPPPASFIDQDHPIQNLTTFNSDYICTLFERGCETHVLAMYHLALKFFGDVVEFNVSDGAVHLNAWQLLQQVAGFTEDRVQECVRYLIRHKSNLHLIVDEEEEVVLVDFEIAMMILAPCETHRNMMFVQELVAFVFDDSNGTLVDKAFDMWRNGLDAKVYCALMVGYIKSTHGRWDAFSDTIE